MLPKAKTYEEVQARFKWNVPHFYNIATDACDVWARTHPKKVALLYLCEGGGEEAWSYGALSAASNKLANAFKAMGITRGDRVGILLSQTPETAITHFASYKLGAITVPLAALFGPEALLYRLKTSGAKGLITDQEGLLKLSGIRNRLPDLEFVVCIDGERTGSYDFHNLLSRSSECFDPIPTLAEDPAVMIYTSGTTGAPKGALLPHRVLLGHIPGIQLSHDLFPQKGDLFWTPSDWAWAGGLFNALMPSLKMGVPVIAKKLRKFDPEEAFRLLCNYKVRNAFIPPTALKIMSGVNARRYVPDLNLRSLCSAGEPLGSAAYDWAKSILNVTPNEMYGQTECNLVLGSCQKLGVSRSGAIGKPVVGHNVTLLKDDGKKAEAGEQGQIAIHKSSPTMFLEYWRHKSLTQAKFQGEWMLTGDQAVMDEDGYFHFVGRNDDIITSAGYRIGPAEVEDCLVTHPKIALAAVVGKPDPVRTEVVKAYIVLNEGTTQGSELKKSIQQWVRLRLSAHEYPREIEFVAELPLTTTGKIIRQKLRHRASSEVMAIAD
ncbi:AMP-binding protein [Flexibacterium corallicola]|uniref:AMP-binding protein n=1 Tax=Flexibacterium corallicola TaxID=3037259 RepID=UPI00286F0D41|nr:AMP-binding protein [Pseudovibrio sp. M1P-2-3]